jgi:predicted dehydrogenase
VRGDDYYSESDWRGTWDKEGGGVIINQAIHSVDLANWMINSPVKSVSCTMSNRNHENIEVEDTAEGLVTYENGVRYGFYAMNNYGCDEPIEVRLHCENGNVIFDYDNATITYNDGTVEEAHPDKNPMVYPGGEVYWGVQHIRQIQQFYKACLGLEPLEITGEEALKTHRLVMQMYECGGLKK